MSKDTKKRLDQLLRSREVEIVKYWTEVSRMPLTGRITADELARQVGQTYSFLQALLAAEGDAELTGPAGAELRANLAEVSATWARRGCTPNETASWVFALKDGLFSVWGGDGGLGEEQLRDFARLSRLIDQMGLLTFEVYAREREKLISDQSEQLLELSTPVIKLWDGVLAVPLIGTLDSARAQVVMETLLQRLVDTGSGCAIIDITGVLAVDTQVAQHILKTVFAARLMGAECIISGIRPQIAQIVVELGIEFGDIVTKASLADALVHALRSGGVDIVRRTSEQKV